MNIQEALDILKENQVTDSVQMLRRWIRQGKIKATIESKKTGYVVDVDSLNIFVSAKKIETKNNKKDIFNPLVCRIKNDEKDLIGGLKISDLAVKKAVAAREKELILKGLKEDSFKYSITELLKGFSKKESLRKHLMLLKKYEVTLNVLGNWVYDEMFNILIDVNELAYPNRNLKTRVKKEYTQKLFEHLESNK